MVDREEPVADWLFDDDLLVAELGEALREDDVPPRMVAAAKDVYAWRTIDAELDLLSEDSADDLEAAGARGTTSVRTLSFEAPSLTIEVDLGPEGYWASSCRLNPARCRSAPAPSC
jgi:hypothetical protein